MSRTEYHPYVTDVTSFTPQWFGNRVEELMIANGVTEDQSWVTFGFTRQYDRSIDSAGVPGEYIQAWMYLEDQEESE